MSTDVHVQEPGPSAGGGLAKMSMWLAGPAFGLFTLTWLAMFLVERDVPGFKSAGDAGGPLMIFLGLPLFGAGCFGALFGLASLLGSARRPVARHRRALALTGLLLGLGVVIWLWPVSTVARRLLVRSIDNANMGALGASVRIYAEGNNRMPPDVEALVAAQILQPSQLRCPDHYPDETRTCYIYIPGQTVPGNPADVVFYGRVDCVSDHGAHVLFADGRVEWVTPYDRVLELVEQTKARLAARAVQSRLPEQ